MCSVLIYGCEAWALDDKTIRKVNGANARMLIRISGKTIQEESRETTTSFDVVKQMRKIRLKWLGHILRTGQDRLIFQAVVQQKQLGTKGSLLMDAPACRACRERSQHVWHIHFLSPE